MNDKLKTMKIHGKDYVTVNSRIEYFRKKYATGRILTCMENLTDDHCVFRSEIYLGDTMVATGHAMEEPGSSQINKTSFLENCETSAIGRALGIFGIGIEGSVASAEEVENAVNQQMDEKAPPAADMSNATEVSDQRTEEPPAASKAPDSATWTVPFKSNNEGKTLNEMNVDDITAMHNWLIKKYDPSSKFAADNKAVIEMIDDYLAANGVPSQEDNDDVPY